MKIVRPAVGAAFAGLAVSSCIAYAADAPKTSATSKTLYLSQTGCGSTAQPGTLELKPQSDSADGCGIVGGIPLDEALYQTGLGATSTDFTSTKKLAPFTIDASKSITGQVASESWYGTPVGAVGGVGTVTWDVALVGTTTSGKSVDFGTTTVSATAGNPTVSEYTAPFKLAVPATAAGQTFKRFTLTVMLRGANLGASAEKYSGDAYVVIPAKAAAPKKHH